MRRAATAVAAATLAYSAMVSLWYCVSGSLDHDEHQFMASAFMLARYGLHPYHDFAYFQMPNLVYLYAPFFLSPYPFLLARLFVGLCAFAICLTVFLTGRSLFAPSQSLTSLIVPASCVLLLIHSPLFRYTSSFVWNHTPSTLCALLAFLALCQGLRGKRPMPCFFVSGVILAVAIGMRLTFAPLVLPFLLAIVALAPDTSRSARLNAIAFGVGGLLGSIPAITFFFADHKAFLFGNVGYARLNTLYRQEMLWPVAMTFAGKLDQLKDSVFQKPGDLLVLLVALCSLALFTVDKVRSGRRARFEIVFLLVLMPFVYLGCMAPTPAWYQYFFASLPFLILLCLYALSGLRGSPSEEPAGLLFGVAALVSLVYGSPFINDSNVLDIVRPQSWRPVVLHRQAERIRDYVDSEAGDDTVLTLSPLYAIEAGLPIYREFVTGPFAWRVSHLLSAQDAANRGLPLPTRIEFFLEERRPRAILTGTEDNPQLEMPIVKAAREVGYRPMVTSMGVVIWLRPD